MLGLAKTSVVGTYAMTGGEQWLTCASGAVVTLPNALWHKDEYFFIEAVGGSVTVESVAGQALSLGTLSSGQAALVWCDGLAWRVSVLGGSSVESSSVWETVDIPGEGEDDQGLVSWTPGVTHLVLTDTTGLGTVDLTLPSAGEAKTIKVFGTVPVLGITLIPVGTDTVFGNDGPIGASSVTLSTEGDGVWYPEWGLPPVPKE